MSASAAHWSDNERCSFCVLRPGQVCHVFRAAASGTVGAGVLHNGWAWTDGGSRCSSNRKEQCLLLLYASSILLPFSLCFLCPPNKGSLYLQQQGRKEQQLTLSNIAGFCLRDSLVNRSWFDALHLWVACLSLQGTTVLIYGFCLAENSYWLLWVTALF